LNASREGTMTLHFRAISPRFKKRRKIWIKVPWHYISGQYLHFKQKSEKSQKEEYHDITFPGNISTHKMRHDEIIHPYHDITFPGNISTQELVVCNNWLVPWHYISGQYLHLLGHSGYAAEFLYHDITFPGNISTKKKSKKI